MMPRFAVLLETGDELRHRIGEANPSLLDQHHHARRCRDDLGERGQIEDRVLGHRLSDREHRALSERVMIANRVAAADEDDGAREIVTGDRGFDERLDRSKSPARLMPERLRPHARLRPHKTDQRDDRESQRQSASSHGFNIY